MCSFAILTSEHALRTSMSCGTALLRGIPLMTARTVRTTACRLAGPRTSMLAEGVTLAGGGGRARNPSSSSSESSIKVITGDSEFEARARPAHDVPKRRARDVGRAGSAKAGVGGCASACSARSAKADCAGCARAGAAGCAIAGGAETSFSESSMTMVS